MIKLAVWTRVDLQEDNPVEVDFFIADSICISGNELNIILEEESIKRINMKDVSMIDFDLRNYKFESVE